MTVDQNNKDEEMARLRKEALEHFIELNNHLPKEKAIELFEEIEKNLQKLNSSISKDIEILAMKFRVLGITQNILVFSLILWFLGLVLPRNTINAWYEPIGVVLALSTVIFTSLFMRFYGRRKK